jgi:hypothetical protein
MMRIYFRLSCIFILLFIISCIDKSDEKVNDSIEISTIRLPKKKSMDEKYLLNPSKSDSLCFFSVQRAKEDMKKYKGVYVQTICHGCYSKPYEAEIKEVLKNKNFKLGIEELDCVVYEGQTRGCYRDYIDLKMKQKYGENYISEIENQAEKLFIKKINVDDAVISCFDLEKQDMPQSLRSGIYFENDYQTTLKTDLPIEQNFKKYIFLDLDFIVEKTGTLSYVEVSYYHGRIKDKKVKQQLIDFSIKTILAKYNNWNPGTYKGNIVRTKIPLRLSFI